MNKKIKKLTYIWVVAMVCLAALLLVSSCGYVCDVYYGYPRCMSGDY